MKRGDARRLIQAALLLLVALVPVRGPAARGAVVNWQRARRVTVVAVEYRFKPDRLVFRQGVAYRLHLVDRGKELHEFTAPEFLKTLTIRNPGVLNAERTELDVQPGEQKDLYLVPLRAGHYRFYCADHDWAGMVGEITVQ